VRPTDGARVAAALPEAALILDWAGGLVWALLPETVDLRARIKGIPGHATLLRASAAAHARSGTFHPEPAPVAAIAEGLRRKFDPRGILNPGIMAT
jgi:glycolate oxidase FAD binding subunit